MVGCGSYSRLWLVLGLRRAFGPVSASSTYPGVPEGGHRAAILAMARGAASPLFVGPSGLLLPGAVVRIHYASAVCAIV